MNQRILIGTVDGLCEFDHAGGRSADALVGGAVTALALDGTTTWAVVDGRTLWARDSDGEWTTVAPIEGAPAMCLAPSAEGLLVGTEEAHLLRLTGSGLAPMESFEHVEGRETWYTPWGDPADVRSIAVDPAGAIYVNVHVGGVVRSLDGGTSWMPTLDIETDVHHVFAPADHRAMVLVAAAVGLGVSRDGGASWQFVTAGLHAHYLRAVAVSEETVLVTASSGPNGRRAAIYRTALAGASGLERCRRGLPGWLDDNVDTACLAARGPRVAFGTEDGRVFHSLDGGESWELLAKGLPAVRSVTLD